MLISISIPFLPEYYKEFVAKNNLSQRAVNNPDITILVHLKIVFQYRKFIRRANLVNLRNVHKFI